MARPAVHRLQATLAADLIPPADRSTAQDKTSIHAAPRSTPTSADRARQQSAETPDALDGRIRGSVMTSCRFAPPPVSPVPRHAITGFRAHRLAPPQTTRNCASRPKHNALPKARRDKCCVPQLPNFKPRRRRISTRQLTKARPKTRQEPVLRLAAHQLRRSAQVDCDATPLPPVMHAEQSTGQGKERAHQLQVALAADLHPPADRTTA